MYMQGKIRFMSKGVVQKKSTQEKYAFFLKNPQFLHNH